MKNLKKVLAVMTAVASLCMSATAFAETKTEAVVSGVANGEVAGLTGTFTHATSVLNVTNPNTVKADTETTILVLTQDATTVTEGMIMYINQQNSTTDGKNFSNMGLKLPAEVTALPGSAEGISYPIRVGYYTEAGNFAIAKGAIVVTTTEVGGKKSFKLQWGEVDGNGTATLLDAAAIVSANAGGNKEFTDSDGNKFTWGTDVFTGSDGVTYKMDNFQWGEVDGNGTATLLDAAAIVSANAGGNKNFTTQAGTSATWGDAENPVEITYSAYNE